MVVRYYVGFSGMRDDIDVGIEHLLFNGGSIVIGDDGSLRLYLDRKERNNCDKEDVMRIGVYLLMNVTRNRNAATHWLVEQGGLDWQHADNVCSLFNEWGGSFAELLDAARML